MFLKMPRRAGLCVVLLLSGCPIAGRLSAQEPYDSVTGAQIDVFYQSGVPRSDAEAVLAFLERDGQRLASRLGMPSPQHVEVRIHASTGKFMSETSTRDPWRGSKLVKGVLHVQPVQQLRRDGKLNMWLSAGFVEAFLDSSVRRGCPLWLREAFAAQWAGETAGLKPPRGFKLSSFSDLVQIMQDNPEPPRRDDVRFVLAQTMKFFMKKYGTRKSYAVFGKFDGSTTVETLFKKHFGDDYTAIERSWSKYVMSLIPMK